MKNKFVYKHKKTGKYYTNINDDTFDIKKAAIFEKYIFLISATHKSTHKKFKYRRIDIDYALVEERNKKLKKLNIIK